MESRQSGAGRFFIIIGFLAAFGGIGLTQQTAANLESLLAALQSENLQVRIEAAKALAKLPEGLGVWNEELAAKLKDDLQVAIPLAEAWGYGSLADPDTPHPLLAAVIPIDAAVLNWQERHRIAVLLGSFGRARAERMMKGRNLFSSLREELAVFSLYGLPLPDHPLLAQSAKRTVLPSPDPKSEEMADPCGIRLVAEKLVEFLKDKDDRVRFSAEMILETLPAGAGKEIARALLAAWDQPSVDFLKGALVVAARHPRFMVPLRSHIASVWELEDRPLRERAARALAAQGVGVIGDLEAALKSASPRTRLGTVQSLSFLGLELRRQIRSLLEWEGSFNEDGSPRGMSYSFVNPREFELTIRRREAENKDLQRIIRLAETAWADAEADVARLAGILVKRLSGRGEPIPDPRENPAAEEYITRLHHDDPEIRRDAAKAMAQWPEGLDVWNGEWLRKSREDLQAATALALAWGHGPLPLEPGALHPLLAAVIPTDFAALSPAERRWISQVLGHFGQARIDLLAGRWPPNGNVYNLASFFYDLSVPFWRVSYRWFQIEPEVVEEILTCAEVTEVIRILVERLGDDDYSVSHTAGIMLKLMPLDAGAAIARELAAVWNPASETFLKEAVGVAERHPRYMADLRPRLAALWDGKSEYLREQSARAVAAQGPGALDDLDTALRSPSQRTRLGAILALEQLGWNFRQALVGRAMDGESPQTGILRGVLYFPPDLEQRVHRVEDADPYYQRIIRLADKARWDSSSEVSRRARKLHRDLSRKRRFPGLK